MYNYPINVFVTEENEVSEKIAVTKRNKNKQVALMEEKLERLRRVSNVIQALENVVAQCSDEPSFKGIQSYAEHQVYDLQQQLKLQLHS